MRNLIILAFLILFSISSPGLAVEDDIFEIEAEGSYRMEADTSIELAEKVALFMARRNAVDSAAKYLTRKSLITAYDSDRDEIYSLAARGIEARILAEKRPAAGSSGVYHVRIRARIKASDFIKAEREDIRQEKKEAGESYQEEMEQPVSAKIEPGRDIAKAYRLLREKKWRLAVIYLNHLVRKYPNWSSLYLAKAIAHYVLHEPVFMKRALAEACRLDNQIACDDLKNLKKVREHDFTLN